jgi:hypothetical protein
LALDRAKFVDLFSNDPINVAGLSDIGVDAPGLTAFIRGDVNANGRLELIDALVALGHIFLGRPSVLPCIKSADVNDDGALQFMDAVQVLWFLFLGGTQPAHPFPVCGEDPTADSLECEEYPPCSS